MSEQPPSPQQLSERARGWLRFLYRKATTEDDWSKEGRPSELWDAKTLPPFLIWHRFDLSESSFALALMADVTPAWREVYSDLLDRMTRRYTTYWAAKDWIEQIGPDPDRDCYPDAFFPAIIPNELRGNYDKPGWAHNGAEPWGLEPDPCAAVGAIYYKSFLDVQLGLHLRVSGDRKYNQGFSVVNDGPNTFHYTHTSLNETIRAKWKDRTAGPH
jgi:hypothetical protein